MTDHPITPPPELVEQWLAHAPNPLDRLGHVATQAARWSADQELEACCEWLIANDNPRWAVALQEGRRPKPPSLAEQALEALETEDDALPLMSLKRSDRFDLIRRALERLQELENNG